MNFKTLFYSVFLIFVFACSDNDSKKGDQAFNNKNYEEAVKQYSEYLKYNPDDFQSMYNLGLSYEKLKQDDKALQSYEAAIKMDDKNANVLMSMGQLYFHKEKFKDAAYYFDKATELSPNLASAQYLKGRSYHQAGDTDKAMEAYNSAININSEYGEAYLYRGALKIYLHRNSSGCNDLHTAQSLNVEEAQEAIEKYCN